MVDPIFTYIGGIAFLVLIIGSMLYLTFSTMDIEEGDEHPGESVVGGVGQEDDEFEPADPISEDEPELVDEDPADREETVEEVSADDESDGADTDESEESDETDADESEGADDAESEEADDADETA